METKTVAVSGCRDWPADYVSVETISMILQKHTQDAVIFVGDCPTGIDSVVRKYCWATGTLHANFPANWKLHGKYAGPKRNEAFVSRSDFLIAFWDFSSLGTASAIQCAVDANIPVLLYDLSYYGEWHDPDTKSYKVLIDLLQKAKGMAAKRKKNSNANTKTDTE